MTSTVSRESLRTSHAQSAEAVPAQPRRSRKGKKSSFGAIHIWLFLAPALVLFLYFKFIPMVAGIWLSFHDVQPFLGNVWVGLENYAQVFSDPLFGRAVLHTVILGVGQSIGAIVGGFVLALILEGTTRRLAVTRTLVFLPVVTATAVIGEVWRIIYFPASGGVLNSILGIFGIGPVAFLENPDTALGSVMAVGIWQGSPYNMVIILAGLAAIDRTLYEAASIDGVSLWQKLRYIVIPALKPALTIVVILAAIRSFRVFTDVWVLTGGGPSGATEVWMTRIYSLGFERNDLGVASAASFLLLLTTVGITLIAAWVMRRRDR